MRRRRAEFALAWSVTLGCGAPVERPPTGDSPSPLAQEQRESHVAATVDVVPVRNDGDHPLGVSEESNNTGKIDSIADYEPPFPDRVDLFVPPKRESAAGNALGGEVAVELMGFVRLDRPRAVLAINGEITPLAEGETRAGVEVVSIHPPTVVLQRGRQRWQASLQ